MRKRIFEHAQKAQICIPAHAQTTIRVFAVDSYIL